MSKKAHLGSDVFKRTQTEKVIEILTESPGVKAKTTPGQKRRPGRPLTQTGKRELTKSSQEGLKEGWTRASFVIQEDILNKLKDYAYTDRRQIKDVITEALSIYLKDKKIIKKAR